MADESKDTVVRKSILILKSSESALKSVNGFLYSRGWEVFSATDLQEIIKLVLAKKPEYLLLCANHPQKAVKSLPKILLQAVQIKIILYVDSASAINMNRMHSMGYSSYILPPVSGPAIERAVFKFEKDELQKQIEKAKSSKGIAGYFANQNKVQDSKSNEFVNIKSIGNDDLEYAINQSLLKSDEEDVHAEVPQSKTNEKSTDDVKDQPLSFAEYEELKLREARARMSGDSDAIALSNEQTKKADSSTLIRHNSQNKNFAKQPDSIIVKGSQQALDSAVKFNPDIKEAEKIARSQNCICIVVDSTRFKGYLIAALGKNRRFDDEFVQNIQVKLYAFLKSQGEKLDEENPLEIKIKPVEFEDWALEQADFLKKSVHNGNEVAMAFFPANKTTPELEASTHEDMLKINIEDLHGDVEVLFDVYIYLQANNRYVLFTPKGRTFLGLQKERLKNKGITHLHMKKIDVKSAKTYTVETYLNNKVEDFNKIKKTKT